MFSWLFNRGNAPDYRFRLRQTQLQVHDLKVRPYQASDREQCIRIYQDNEPDRFPTDHLELFVAYLESGAGLILVVERQGAVLATGGIEAWSAGYFDYHWLSYGLVAPACHGQGLGTVMLLSRLALITDFMPWTKVYLQLVRRSQSFYEQFGFSLDQRDPQSDPRVAGLFMADVHEKDIDEVRRYLAAAGLPIANPAPKIPCSRVRDHHAAC